MLREVEGLSVDETAEALDIPAATVKTRFLRARRRLKEALAPEVHDALTGTFPFAGADCAALTERVMARLDTEDLDRLRLASRPLDAIVRPCRVAASNSQASATVSQASLDR